MSFVHLVASPLASHLNYCRHSYLCLTCHLSDENVTKALPQENLTDNMFGLSRKHTCSVIFRPSTLTDLPCNLRSVVVSLYMLEGLEMRSDVSL